MKVKSDMFEGPNGLPKFLKQMSSESDEKYEKRIFNFLLCMSAEQFGALGMKLDPEDETQLSFFELYSNVSARRSVSSNSGSQLNEEDEGDDSQ
eukprot:CAMPEP_0176357476 /NCGR_PEP_ID=MMETSP0126-20121128/14801_1 /TAXON_ID=141414 ORGANISM="Strombidinopsis acuminatum, Strain SPMC142" /NCGR_SAMPLE_ID=MMETSP0126 /ASSEMBLY_ACC=CAM_ASM_000229 /LENGTH=93 /DNA_ID=CAMNT_0017711101 /DNA_START=1435 /DNA_END=1716 /DNA_ORIENTATION=+